MSIPLTSRILPVVLLASALTSQATKEQVEKILQAATKPQVTAILEHLVNDIGPRLTSSDNLTKACEWARDTFASYGLDARIEEWGSYPVGFNRGPWSGRVLRPESMELSFKTNAWTAGTEGKVKGPLLSKPSNLQAAETLGDKAKGAWFLSASSGGQRGRRGGGGNAVDALLEKNGAAGFISGSRSDLLTTGGRPPRGDLPTMPRVDMLPAHFKKLQDLVASGDAVEVEFDIQNHFTKGPIKLYNVIAELKGTTFPDEYVIVGGHIDSWDGATGTTDNGTGVATTMESARLIMAAGVKPERTIRFMLWSGEEQGLLGSKAFIRKHPEENDRVSAVLVHDGGTNYVSGISAQAAMIPALELALAPIQSANLQFKFSINTIQNFRPIGSDHDSYLGAGVPGFFWRQSGKAVYRRTHHTQHDTFETAIRDYQRHSSKVIALGAVGIANLPEKLSREGFSFSSFRFRRPGQASSYSRRLFGVRTDGLKISRITKGSVAEKAGLEVGDTFVKIANKEIKTLGQFRRALRSSGDSFKITVDRAGKKVVVTATFKKQ